VSGNKNEDINAVSNLPEDATPIGYACLIERHALKVISHWRSTYTARTSTRRELEGGAVIILPSARGPASEDLSQLLFAYRYEGVNLAISRALFKAAPDLGDALAAQLRAHPTSAYARRAWLLFEVFTGRRLDLPDVAQGNYKPLLDPERQIVGVTRKIRRQRIDLNTLGGLSFSPMVRRTARVASISAVGIHQRLLALVERYDPGCSPMSIR